MILHDHFPLKSMNTFGLPAMAAHYAGIEQANEVQEFLREVCQPEIPLLILGAGSNVLFRKDFPGWVVRLLYKGFDVVSEDEQTVALKVNAGEIWDDAVKYCVEHGFGGIENLSLIPGTVGAAPIQNIGAYGVEIGQVLESVEMVLIRNGERKVLTAGECRFGYRDSIFKNELRNETIITSITLKLTKAPKLRMDYGGIREEMQAMNVAEPRISDVREAICAIRRRKLPDPLLLGNAGSFFKNPAVEDAFLENLKTRFPEIPTYPASPGYVKIPAAWLIEQCGWKGRRIGDAGVHIHQPLVLVNYGNATGADIIALAGQIKSSVMDRFGIGLKEEVNIVP